MTSVGICSLLLHALSCQLATSLVNFDAAARPSRSSHGEQDMEFKKIGSACAADFVRLFTAMSVDHSRGLSWYSGCLGQSRLLSSVRCHLVESAESILPMCIAVCHPGYASLTNESGDVPCPATIHLCCHIVTAPQMKLLRNVLVRVSKSLVPRRKLPVHQVTDQVTDCTLQGLSRANLWQRGIASSLGRQTKSPTAELSGGRLCRDLIQSAQGDRDYLAGGLLQ